MLEAPKINRRILVAPLDWGLGHATRCIPLIAALRHQGCEVWIAASGPSLSLLREAFPEIPWLDLPGYGVQYGRRGAMFSTVRQIPAIRRHIFTEHAWLQQAVREFGFQGIVSDNRYGLYHHAVPSVLVTHQLQLQMPSWISWAKGGVQRMLYRHIGHFPDIWVPDLPVAADSLAGRLSHPGTLPASRVTYIGYLSRMRPGTGPTVRRNECLIVLSGPEPQRTLLEDKIWEQLPGMPVPVTVVRGLPGISQQREAPSQVTVHNHLDTETLNRLMLTCRIMIGRGGYSSLMDAAVLGTPVVAIPTPGQTEQEYLARRLSRQGRLIHIAQEKLDLTELWRKIETNLPLPLPAANGDLLTQAISTWLQRI